MRIWIPSAALVLITTLLIGSASAYPVGPSLSLQQLEREAQLICKVVAIASDKAVDSPLKSQADWGYDVLETKLRVVEIYKGQPGGETISFIHYAPKKPDGGRGPYMPQNYVLEAGRPYILFAKSTDRPGVFQQLWENHKSMEDQGLVRAADETKHGKKSLREVLWTELTTLLKSGDREDITYAIRHLDEMSGDGFVALNDFDRLTAMEAIEPHIRSKDDVVARLAIQALGSRNPYLSPDYAAGWLATIGKGHIPGYAQWKAAENTTGKRFWKSLAQVADGDRPPEIRELAIRALGFTREPQLKQHVSRWTSNPEPRVRQAGAILLADFPELATDETIARLAKDPEPLARAGLANAVGYGQWVDHVRVLGDLVDDADPRVAAAAAISLLSFSLDVSRTTLQAHVEHLQFKPLFVNALAQEHSEPYLTELCEIVRKDLQPKNWWGGRIPWGVSWDILFRYVQNRPADDLKGGKLDDVLSALESPKYYSSSEPRDLYALYVQRGLTDRAKAFREVCRKRLTYDIDYFFNMVDANPKTYVRDTYVRSR